MLERIIQRLQTTRATEHMIETVRKLYRSQTDAQLKEFVATTFRNQNLPTFIVTLNSTKLLNPNIPSEAAAFLHYLKQDAEEIIERGHQEEGSELLRLHDRLLSFLEQVE